MPGDDKGPEEKLKFRQARVIIGVVDHIKKMFICFIQQTYIAKTNDQVDNGSRHHQRKPNPCTTYGNLSLYCITGDILINGILRTHRAGFNAKKEKNKDNSLNGIIQHARSSYATAYMVIYRSSR
jgi:hypothetical protein